MPRLILGSTRIEVSRIAFGTWQLSPRFWGDQPESEILAAMQAANEAGVNFFDTADAYGDGLAETVLGRFLSGKPRESFVVCTKVFNHFNPDGSRYPDLSAAYVRERCEIQLKRLRLETIDIYLLHMFDPLTPLEEVTGILESLKGEGKIRAYGVSNHTLEQLKALRRLGRYEVVQPGYSLIASEIESDILPYCHAENIGVIIYSPMHKGLLTGKYRGDEVFSDFRKSHPDFQGERFRKIAAAVRSLEPIARKAGLTVYQLVLSATLMHPSIDVAVVGIKTVAQILEAAGAASRSLSREDYFAIRKALAVGGLPKIQDAKGERK